MASMAATAVGLGMSDMMASTRTLPRCSSVLAIPTAVASSHHNDKSVSMMILGTAVVL